MKYKKHRCRILWAVILTLLINVLCLPLWTQYGYGDFVWTLFNKEARVDFVYTGDELTVSPPLSFEVKNSKPIFCSLYEGIDEKKRFFRLFGHRLRARANWQKVSFKVHALQDGKIAIILRGPAKSDDSGSIRYLVPTDYRNFRINGKEIFSESKTLLFSKNYIKNIPAKKHEILQVDVEFRRHAFSIDDFVFPEFGKLWYIVTGNILLFFLIYRLLGYFAINRERFKSSSDILLISVFFCCLFIPMMDISDGEISQREVRKLAVKPALKEILKGNMSMGKYEEWFNDRFFGRVPLIKIHDRIRNMLSHVIRAKKAIYFKENGWDFLIPLISNFDCRNAFLQSSVQTLIRLNEFCQQNKIKLYVLETPKKESVYKELLSDKYGFDEKKFMKVSRAQETIRKEARKRHIPYIYPYEALRDAVKSDFVFFKCSHHWTDWGAYVGYRELMKEIRKDFPDMPVVTLDDYQKSQNWLQRDTYWRDYRLPWHFYGHFNDEHLASIRKTFYNYYDHKDANKMLVRIGKFTKQFTYPQGKHNVMLIGTSQNEVFLQFLPYSAGQTKYIRLNFGQVKGADEFKILKLYKKDILAFSPDILILSIYTDDLPRLRDISLTK